MPDFFYRYLKDTSSNKLFRSTDKPNLRVQGGDTMPLLCAACESRFSRWEVEFARRVFQPVAKGPCEIQYEGWLRRFLVSVAWRGGVYRGEEDPSLSEATAKLIGSWRLWLSGEVGEPEGQHFIVFPPLLYQALSFAMLTSDAEAFVSRAIGVDVLVGNARSGGKAQGFVAVVTKAPFMLLVSVTGLPHQSIPGAEVNESGMLMPDPEPTDASNGLAKLVLSYVRYSAPRIDEARGRLSPVQQRKVIDAFQEDIAKGTPSAETAVRIRDEVRRRQQGT